MVYNAAHQFTSLKRYEDLTATNLVAETTYTYDSAGRLTDLTHKKGATTFADYDWTFDVNGRISQLVSDDGTTDLHLRQFRSAHRGDAHLSNQRIFHLRLHWKQNQCRLHNWHQTTSSPSDGSYDYLYDDEGNRTKKTDKTTSDYVEYEWDHRNHLVTVTFRNSSDTKTKEVTYDYDAFDRRIAKHVDDNGNARLIPAKTTSTTAATSFWSSTAPTTSPTVTCMAR